MEFLAPDDNAIVDKLTMDDLPPMPDTYMDRNYTNYHDNTNSYKIPYNKDTEEKYRLSKTGVYDDLEDIKYHKQLYARENLYPDQLTVFEHVTANPKDIVLLQGGPGSGKTFTMLTVGNHFVEKMEPPNAVIFKRDTDDTVHKYRFSANAFTIEKFMTRIFHLNSSDYETLERQLSEPMSVEHFLNAVVYLTRKLTLCPNGDDFRHPLLILELYTVEPKPFLLIIMMTLHRYRIGAVICGDKKLLENATHAGQCSLQCSAYDIVSAFSTKTFNLSINHRLVRCYDFTYNDKVNFIGTLSNDRELDDWGYALVSAMFYKNLMKNVDPADTILARNHKSLTRTVVAMVNEKKIPTSYWYIKRFKNVDLPHVYINPDKYLTFLPLIVGNPYFVNEFSERMLCTLEKIYFEDEHQAKIQKVAVRMSKTNEMKIIESGECSDVMFSRHMWYLMNSGNDEPFDSCHLYYVFNFPLYPAFIKTIHMSIGRTIRSSVSLILNESTFQDLYVAMSRVTSSENINSVVIPNKLQHLISVLLNFDVTDLKPLRIGQIKEIMLNGNYVYYDVSAKKYDSDMIDKLKMAAERSLSLDTQEQRKIACKTLSNLVTAYGVHSRNLKPNINQADDDLSATYKTTLPLLVKMKNTITGLATLTPLESRVWIHEFLYESKTLEYMRVCENSVFSNPGDFNKKFKELNYNCNFTVSDTYKPGETPIDFMIRTSTQKRKGDLEADPDFLKEWKIMKAAIPTPDVNTLPCVQVFIHNLVHRDRGDSDELYELLKKRIQSNTKKRTIE